MDSDNVPSSSMIATVSRLVPVRAWLIKRADFWVLLIHKSVNVVDEDFSRRVPLTCFSESVLLLLVASEMNALSLLRESNDPSRPDDHTRCQTILFRKGICRCDHWKHIQHLPDAIPVFNRYVNVMSRVPSTRVSASYPMWRFCTWEGYFFSRLEATIG